MVLSSAQDAWYIAMPKALHMFASINWAKLSRSCMILKQELLNLSINILNEQVEISQIKCIYSKLQSLEVSLYNIACKSDNWALIGQKRELDSEFGAEFRCKLAVVCIFLTPKLTVYVYPKVKLPLIKEIMAKSNPKVRKKKPNW